jgi:uncharacterized protein (TIGR02246 family)
MFRNIKIVIVAIIVNLLVVSIYGGTAPVVSENDIAALFNKWNASLKTGKAEEVVKNYADDAILIPTVSNKVRHNHSEIKDYFEHFVLKKPNARIDEENIRIYGDIAVNSGLYTFYTIRDGKAAEIKARFTFVYHKIGDRWLIVEHHSSMLPEKVQ